MTQQQQVIEFFEKEPLLRSQELTDRGIDRKTIKRMVDSGELIRVARGLYRRPDYIPHHHYSLLEARKSLPNGVICLLSALDWHDIGTQNPSQVWVAVPRRTWRPTTLDIPVRIVTYSPKTFEAGISQVQIENMPVNIYNIPRTIADCFKYRNKIGLDVAIEALKDVLRQRRTTVDELLRYAEICRVRAVMRPYMEILL